MTPSFDLGGWGILGLGTIIGGDSQIIYGGKGANQAVASHFAGADVKFITQLGNDTFGESLKNHFNELGFEQKYILHEKTTHSGIAPKRMFGFS